MGPLTGQDRDGVEEKGSAGQAGDWELTADLSVLSCSTWNATESKNFKLETELPHHDENSVFARGRKTEHILLSSVSFIYNL